MERISQLLPHFMLLACLVMTTGRSSLAAEFTFELPVNEGQFIVAEAPNTAFTVSISAPSEQTAYSHQAYTHIAVLAPEVTSSATITITLVTDDSKPVERGEFSLYAQSASASLNWLQSVSEQPETLSTEDLTSAINQQDSDKACMAKSLLAQIYLTQDATEEALALLATPQQYYPCWQLAALAMSTLFDNHRFIEASQIASALLPQEFNQALANATGITNPANWPSTSEQFQAVDIAHDTVPHPTTSYIYTQLLLKLGFSNLLHGNVASSQTLMEAGKFSLELALSAASQRSYKRLLAESYNGLATYWALANDNSASARYLEQAIEQSLLSGTEQDIAELMNNLALVYLWSGRWSEALQTLREAYQRLNNENSSITAAILTANLASTYLYMGDWQTAERYYQRALTLSDDEAKDKDTTHIYIALAKIAIAQKNWSSALNSLLEAQTIAGELRPEKLALVYALQARVYASSGQLVNARTALNSAQSNFSDTIKNADKISALDALGYTQIQLGDYPEAAKSIELLNALIGNDHPQLVTLATLQYQWQKAVDPTNHAILAQTFQKANQQMLQLGSELDAYQMGPHWFNKIRNLYNEHLDTLFSEPSEANIEQALALLETYKTHLMMRKRGDQERQRLKTDPAIEALWEQRLLLESALVNSVGEEQKALLQLKLDNVKEQWFTRVNSALNETTANLASPLSLTAIQAELTRQQVVLRYIQTDKQCYVVAISATNHSLQTVSCPPAQNEGLSGAEITYLYQDYKANAFIPAWVLEDNNLNDIIWLADGLFYGLPMAQLKIANAADSYLGSNYSLRQTPSLNAYLQIDESASAPLTIGIFDSPDFENGASSTDAGWRSIIPELPWARSEGDQIVAQFTHSPISRYSGAVATQQALLSKTLRNTTVLHIATHSYFDPNEPDIVGLAVARDLSAAETQSGFLPQSALLSHPFHNQLVVLSGCETALGRPMAHDGLQSLAYGMLTAGADSVISTRWKVADKAAATFMGYFYAGLANTGNSAKAMRYAQQKMQHHPRFKHPMHWAGFTLSVINRQAELFPL